MHITSAKFIKSITQKDGIMSDGLAQVAFIGRSNVGKSSIINSLTKTEGLAKTSSFPGRTQQINFFLLNGSVYLVDLPGYGYADISESGRQRLQQLIDWYLFSPGHNHQRIFLLIDAEIGFTEPDFEMLHALEDHGKEICIVANKVDKIKPSQYEKQHDTITTCAGSHNVIFYSARLGTGVGELADEVFKSFPKKNLPKKPVIFGGSTDLLRRGKDKKIRNRHK
jgi:GTP-binding protein